ncbi:hypothetical protein Tco_0748687 [Tanacetum coccineum]|uniref:Uncharacterized protein n=1 Tax=Tanacetum coccineum TaxID=301880 RepID=A0ABQ4YXA0_9ASTR
MSENILCFQYWGKDSWCSKINLLLIAFYSKLKVMRDEKLKNHATDLLGFIHKKIVKMSHDNVGYSLRRIPKGGIEHVQFLKFLASIEDVTLVNKIGVGGLGSSLHSMPTLVGFSSHHPNRRPGTEDETIDNFVLCVVLQATIPEVFLKEVVLLELHNLCEIFCLTYVPKSGHVRKELQWVSLRDGRPTTAAFTDLLAPSKDSCLGLTGNLSLLFVLW